MFNVLSSKFLFRQSELSEANNGEICLDSHGRPRRRFTFAEPRENDGWAKRPPELSREHSVLRRD